MKKNLLVFFALITTGIIHAQPTWSEDAAEVIYNNCTECHNPIGVGGVSFLEYETAYDYRSLIQSYVEFNVMPPWLPDSSFQHYFDERILTEYERNTIIDWANEGALEGDPLLAPPPPVYTGDKILPGTPDLVIEMPKYMSKATEESDDYICISLPTGLIEERKVKAIEIIPGNPAIVHHCLVYADADGSYATDSTGGDCGGPSDEPLMSGYTPGASPTIFPANEDFSSGMILTPGSNIILAMHYPHGSYGEFDQTRVHIYFYDEPVTGFREILAGAFLQNWEFELPPHELTEVTAEFPDVPFDLSVLSVFPHMHLLGYSIESYAIHPETEDTIPFVRIPRYDFDWQDFYWFKYMQHMPNGSDLKGRGVYNNTVENPHNPHDPPITVYPGLNTTDEMFQIYFHIMEYEEGDEFINVDSLNTVFLTTGPDLEPVENGISVYPNPFDNSINIDYSLEENSFVTIFIYDLRGRVVNKLFKGEQYKGQQQVTWDGTTTEGTPAASGIYNYSMLIDGNHYSGRIIKR